MHTRPAPAAYACVALLAARHPPPSDRGACPAHPMQVHLFCAVYFMLYMVAFTGITIW